MYIELCCFIWNRTSVRTDCFVAFLYGDIGFHDGTSLVSILMEASAYLVFFFGVTLSVLLLKGKMFNHAFCAIFMQYFCPFKSSLSFFSWRILSHFWIYAGLQYSVHPDWSCFLFIYPPSDFACTSPSASVLALHRSPIRAIARPCPCDLHQAGILCEQDQQS